VWGNYIDRTFVKIAVASISIGPTYVFRNVANVSRRSRYENGGKALEFGVDAGITTPSPATDGGVAPDDGGTVTLPDGAVVPADDSATNAATPTDVEGGCGCRTTNNRPAGHWLFGLLLLARMTRRSRAHPAHASCARTGRGQ